ncbi:MAG TPA: hypothetical protein VF629_05775 [Hymenobacter sp.]|jgi:hypothetical protein|uniref:hypothetical protein n=1 Tax=Hymenobacter sp. TaxID=1898978 RepID=UPI002EDB11A3
MRIVLLAIFILVVPHVVRAQLDFRSGTFQLKSSPETQRTGLLRLGSNLVVKQMQNGPAVKYPLEEVLTYHLGLRHYVRASSFLMRSPSGWTHEIANNTFVELLDTGSVSLMRYEYVGQTSDKPIYLLQRVGEARATAIPYNAFDGAGQAFYDALAPYVAARPDLLAVMQNKKVTIYSLHTFIHALNRKVPFLDYSMQGSSPSSK